jgi:hypothetical protein
MFQSNVRAYEAFMLRALREIVLGSAFLSLFTTVIAFCVGIGAFLVSVQDGDVKRVLFATVAWEVAAIALASFVVTMFVYLFIRIELDLRMQAEAHVPV